MYEPREDSLLLQEQVKKYAIGNVLDVGTGTGIQAITAAKKRKVSRVVAVDISKDTIDFCKREIKNRKIDFVVSDLFSNVKGKFDTIIFNPPYLPEDVRLKDITINGGKKGYETIERFFSKANEHLKENGIILIVFSSLTKKEKVDEIIQRYGFEFTELKQKQIFFEILYVYLVRKSDFLKIMNKRRIKNIIRFTRGKRGIIFIGNFKNKKISIKFQRKDIAAKGAINNEIKFLKILNKYKIGPKLLFYGNDYFASNFVDGILIDEFLKKEDKEKTKRILKKIFNQCFLLDKLKINKEELHNPYKHIIVTRRFNPVLIDFERARRMADTKNVTQFCQYIISRAELLNKKGFKIDKEKIIELAKIYKRNKKRSNLNKILQIIN